MQQTNNENYESPIYYEQLKENDYLIKPLKYEFIN